MEGYDITLKSLGSELTTFIGVPVDAKISVCVTSFYTLPNFEILNPTDQMTVNGQKVTLVTEAYSELDESTVLELLNAALEPTGAVAEITRTHLFRFKNSDGSEISIEDLTYNLQLLTGLYPFNGPLKGASIVSETIPYYLSTPTLYLVGNMGSLNYTNIINPSIADSGMITMMKITNSSSIHCPIQAGNCDFVMSASPSVLSNATFRLVDENLMPVKLLNPFIITVKIRILPQDPDPIMLGGGEQPEQAEQQG